AYRRVYVWEFPVRLYHWVNAFCLVALCVTGYIIGKPTAIFHSQEAYQQYWWGTVRFVHFASAYIYFFNGLGRLYWAFVGNRYARWQDYVPYTWSRIKKIFEVLTVDIWQVRLKGSIPIGHNMLAGTSYFASMFVFFFQAVSGFALYSSMSSSFFPRLFNWIVPLMGGEMAVRQWHHLFMWFFITFTIFHMYLVFYHDWVEARGTTSSIIDGWKFVHEDVDAPKEVPEPNTTDRRRPVRRRSGPAPEGAISEGKHR
ncbi:MAG TPA: Ni/Fe-hydrogenase, b-type cytochrome subunit, partial [Blastocatellia bacterium]|nr:Ni/Fe-hydrogenase, b-type cytochrome subunit [Blastocatellia bacterium]